MSSSFYGIVSLYGIVLIDNDWKVRSHGEHVKLSIMYSIKIDSSVDIIETLT